MTELYVKIPMNEKEKDEISEQIEVLRTVGIAKISKPEFFKSILYLMVYNEQVKSMIKKHIKELVK